MAEYKLELKGICKSFPGVKALDNVQLSLRPGTVHALMGENGAGKSTLMKCLFGIYKMDAGEVYLDGQKIEVNNPDEAPWYIRNYSLFRREAWLRTCIWEDSRQRITDRLR